jgi:uncharacterized membrane protein
LLSASAREPTSTATAPSHPVVRARRSVQIKQACTIRRAPDEVYAFWRDVGNLHRIVRHALEITVLSETESRWVLEGPPGARRVEWHALIIGDEPHRLIAWRTADGADVPNAGSVHFTPAPGDEGTEVLVELRFEPPGGRAGRWLAKLTGREPAQQLASTLRRLKALLEAGEIPTIEGQPRGRVGGEPGRSEEREPAEAGVAS